MKLLSAIFMTMPPNRKVLFIKSFSKAMRSLHSKTDCKVYHQHDGQFIQIRSGTICFGYEKKMDHEHKENSYYGEADLNASLMQEFENMFCVFLEHFAQDYDQHQPQTEAVS